MPSLDGETRDILVAELDLHKTEFGHLREEILQWLESERQYIHLCLVAIGAEIGLVSIIFQNRLFVVLLLFPFVFQIVLWEMLNAVQGIYALSSYLTEELIPRVNAIFRQLGRGDEGTILGWEVWAAERMETGTRAGVWSLALGSLMPSRYWVPVLAIAVSMIAYLLLVRGYDHSMSGWELVLILVNLTFLIVSGVRSTLMTRFAARRARRLRGEERGGAVRTE